MLVFIICLLPIALFGLKISKKNKFYPDYISKKQTAAINGIFTLLIFFSHVSTYIDLNGKLDAPYAILKEYLGQLVVVSFLFYSGFGMMESIKKKGLEYVKKIPTNRLFRVLYHLDLAVLLFIIVNLILQNQLTPSKTLLAFIGWTSIGNSNWYIFVVLALYLVVFISFMIARGNKYAGTVITSILTVVLIILLKKAGKDSWWYNTALVYPAGMIFSLIKNIFDKIAAKKDVIWLGCTLGIFVLYNVFEHFKKSGLIFYELWAILFAMLIVVFTMKFKIGNKILDWVGSHVFSIYMLQRIPMMIFEKIGLAQNHKYIFVIACLAVTLGLSAGFDMITTKIDKLIYERKTKNC